MVHIAKILPSTHSLSSILAYVTATQLAQRNNAKEGDIILITVGSGHGDNSSRSSLVHLFGLVLSCRKVKLGPRDMIDRKSVV